MDRAIGGQAVLQGGFDAADLALAGQEDQHAALGLSASACRAPDRPPRASSRAPGPAGGRSQRRLDREGPALGGDHRRIAHQGGDRRGVERGRHHQQDQIVAQRRAHLQAQRQPQIGIERAFVELVEDHRADAGQIRDRTAASGSGCPRSPPRSGRRRDARLAADAVADGLRPPLSPSVSAMRSAAARAAIRRGSSITMRPGQPGVQQRQRHARRLAGAGRGLKHGLTFRAQPVHQLGQDGVDGQRVMAGSWATLSPS